MPYRSLTPDRNPLQSPWGHWWCSFPWEDSYSLVLSTFCCSSSPPILKRREHWAGVLRVSSDVCWTGEFQSEELVWDDGSSSRTGTQLALLTQLPVVVVFFVGVLLLVRELLIWLKTAGAIERREDYSHPYPYGPYSGNPRYNYRQDSTYRVKRDSDNLLIRVLNRWVARVHVLLVLLTSLECWRTELWSSLWKVLTNWGKGVPFP